MPALKSKREAVSVDLASAVSDAFGELQALGEEMREAFDNTPESLQQGGAGAARGEAADALENFSEPDVPESVAALSVTITRNQYGRRGPSRSERRDDACAILAAAIEALDSMDDDIPQQQKDDGETLRDELDNLQSEAELVEFPGMFG